jgi:hypothetical protein
MGCDYYIEKSLKIYYFNEKIYSSITLERDNGYYYYPSIDEDDENYETIFAKTIEDQLRPTMEPIIIYEDSIFKNNKLDNKYKSMIERGLKKDKKEWKDIKKIMKVESRWERD